MIRYVCTCGVCKAQWGYKDGTDIDLIRASSSPCGHQGLFTVEDKLAKMEESV